MSDTLTTVQERAEVAYGWFETAKRNENSEDTYDRLKDDAPEWVKEIVYKAHGDFLPDDWRYACIRAALGWIGDGNDDYNDEGEFADQCVDVFTSERIIWLGSNLNRAGYCDEAQASGLGEDADVITLIGLGQYLEASEVFGLVLSALEDASTA